MGQVTLIVEHQIKPGRLDDFKERALHLIERTMAEVGALRYDYFLSEDGQRDLNIEVYQDAEALLAHARNVADLLPGITDAAPIVRLEVIGDASPEVRAEVAGVVTGYFQPLGGWTASFPTCFTHARSCR